MDNKRSTFISEIFWTTDQRFSFQVLGPYYHLYDRKNGYYFTEEFRSFKSMQDFMNAEREKDNGKTENRL